MDHSNINRILFFDGDCAFCIKAVRFVLKRDKKGLIWFAPLKGETAKKMKVDSFVQKHPGTVVYIENNNVYTHSTAAIKICKHLSGGWPLATALILIPSFIRNYLYKLISDNRHRISGPNNCCIIDQGKQNRVLD